MTNFRPLKFFILHTALCARDMPGKSRCLASPVTWQYSNWLQLEALASVGEYSRIRPSSVATFLSGNLPQRHPSSAEISLLLCGHVCQAQLDEGSDEVGLAHYSRVRALMLHCDVWGTNLTREVSTRHQRALRVSDKFVVFTGFGQNGRINSNFK